MRSIEGVRTGWRGEFLVLADKAFDALLSLYIFITIFLPSGSIYGVNLKLPLYGLLIPLAVYTFFRQRQATVPAIALTLIAPTVLFLWIVVSAVYRFALDSALRQCLDLALTILLCWLVALFCGHDVARRLRFLRLVLNAEVATCLLKVGLIVYAFARGIPVVQVVNSLSDIFGVGLMTMDLGALLGRIQFVSDAVIPICIFIVLRHRDRLQLSSFRSSATIVLLLFSVVMSFSRYFWAYTLVAFIVGLLLGKRDRFQAALLVSIVVVTLVSLPALAVLYELRFSEAVAGSSDIERAEQAPALIRFFLDAPLLGHGFGSYTPDVVRTDESSVSRYGYEMQLLALAGQTGIVGMSLLLALLGWYYRRLWSRSTLSIPDRLALGTLLSIWLAAGLYNPLLLSPVASVTYASLATLCALPSRKEEVLQSHQPIAA